jgi:integrating conjugative element protein (TIGR03758 family)
MTADQLTAFTANGGFTPSAAATLFLGVTFTVLLVWGVWAMHAAYIGWTESTLSGRRFFAVLVRVVALYLVLTYLLLS